MDPIVTVCEDPTDAVRDAILAALTRFNTDNGYPPDPAPVALTITDDDGKIVGGLWGRTVDDWLFVDYLFVPSSLRGRDLGMQLMSKAEAIAIERGCVGSWLTTFTFQARGFYEKLGYDVFGTLDNAPRDNTRMFLRKHLRK